MNIDKRLVIRALPVPPAIMLSRVATNPDVADMFGEIDFGIWESSVIMRDDLKQGRVDLCIMPVNTAAGLYNDGLPVRMLGVTLWGILHVLTSQEKLQGWADLRAQTVAVPFKGNMPDTIFRFLAGKNGLDAARDMTIHYEQTYVHARNALLEGSAVAACLPEPVASSALYEARRQGRPVRRMLDLQQEWARATGGKPRYTQAGPVIRADMAKRPEAVAVLKSAIAEAAAWMAASRGEAARTGAPLLGGLPEETVAESLGMIEHQAGWFPETRAEAESFLRTLMELEPDLVKGGLPGDGFYVTNT